MSRIFGELSFRKELLEMLGIFFLGAGINYVLWCDGCLEDRKIFLVNIIVSGSFWVLLWKGSQYIVLYLDSIMSWVEYPLKRFVVSLLSVIVYTTVVVYVLDFIIDVFIFGKSATQAIQYLNYASLSFAIMVTLGVNTFLHGRAFLLEWRQTSIDNERLKTEHVSSQYNSLKNQVNPHFLFNSLNALSSLVYENQDRAVEFIRKLSDVYRYVLDSKDEEIISLEREMDFVKSFAFLQKIRFGDNLNVEIGDFPSGLFVPPLAIQVLVENAIKHNVVSEKDPLRVSIDFVGETCVVSNSLKEKRAKDSTGIGLNNLKERYKYLSDQEVKVEKTEDSFTVTLPLLRLEK